MKKGILLLIGFIFVIMLYFYYGGKYMDNKEEKNYIQFNKKEINGNILDLKEYARGAKLRFKEGEVIFYPLTSQLNENNIFLYTAKKGDKVLKRPYQDTLTLVKENGVILKYTFMKPK
ncbi:hypothetical protein SAMN05421796_101409 [Chryseobacterium piscicola]|uniref:Uncharacterized protein n=1 Tax=Chryseobacterium piscicola TaxID=551459 RepID=A0A1N7K9Z0_9FLAO|nr:hypothetical protein [Chryseobacterium piscicola]PQA96421.1 hypothetical protein B0A70_04710 [Chryseobacterium piscicola]SIS58401.1 hypothetical protein SAMN05421796_101409 [Chryseobacterium piscicola]